ncbi:MAG: peptidase C39 family protein [Chloroflexi bacterium]|nr:peptidase C39 family protein [Chloroflexota bacterium]
MPSPSLVPIAVLLLLMLTPLGVAQAETPPFHEFWRAGGEAGFADWRLAGVRDAGGHLTLGGAAMSVNDSDSELADVLASAGAAYAGAALGPVRETSAPYRELIPSWNAETPPGTWIEVRARARLGERWSGWYRFGPWSEGTPERRQSVRGQNDADARLLTDTLRLTADGNAYQLLVLLASDEGVAVPSASLVGAVASRPSPSPRPLDPDRSIWGTLLAVPQRSQMVYPNGGEVWCSPTSTSMVLAYWSAVLGEPSLLHSVPEVAAGTYDPVYRGNGNWPFNTAYAAQDGLTAYVSRFSSVAQVEQWLGAGVPVVASLAWEPGDLDAAPVGSTNGHLLVVVGIDAAGDVVVNDPAADPRRGQSVRRVYRREQFERLWLTHSGGTVYLIYPEGRQPSSVAAFGAW